MRLVNANLAPLYLNESACEQIKNMPAVDAVEVVRCNECKHFDTSDFDGDPLYGCTLESAMLDITPDSFCSYGERKEDGGQ